MVSFQIVEKPGAGLFKELKKHMGDGTLKTFSLMNRGKKIVHTSYPGWINWAHKKGIVSCNVKCPRKPGYDWQILTGFLGRLSDKYADKIHSITIQFPDAK